MIASLLLAALVAIAVYVGTHRLSGLQFGMLLLLGGFGVTLVIAPNLASRIAVVVGVGRGTDLILYAAIIGGLFVTANFYFRAKCQEAQIVEIVREVALLTAELPKQS